VENIPCQASKQATNEEEDEKRKRGTMSKAITETVTATLKEAAIDKAIKTRGLLEIHLAVFRVCQEVCGNSL
jgi:hypothetical protein